MSSESTRRDFTLRLAALGALAIAGDARPLRAQDDGVKHDAESIHQEIAITAPPAKVYGALTDAAIFTKMTAFSMIKNAPPAKIDAVNGGAFALFDSHIVGRNIELVTNARVVQAWRPADWPAGVYSIARFELTAQGSGTMIVFDHTGFPAGQGTHLAMGWQMNYWGPMKQVLAG